MPTDDDELLDSTVLDDTVMDDTVLDNAVWHALGRGHAGLAQVAGGGRARRYPSEISIFGALDGLGPDDWAALAELVGPGGTTVLFRREVGPVPDGWRIDLHGHGNQFVATALVDLDPTGLPPIIALDAVDAERMLALTRLTRPGPFALRTHELGHFYGIFDDGELVAMAGERFQLDGYTEVSAVCTHPAARGRGLAAYLTHHVATQIQARNAVAFLHVAAANDGARRVYERLGFTLRTPVEFIDVTLQEQP